MNCSRCETLLSEYLEDLLDPRVHEAVGNHLHACPECARLVREVEKVREDLAAIPEIGLPPDVVDQILEKTTGKFRPRSVWADMIVPMLRPFLTQRFVFATMIMFLFLSLMVNVVGPDFSALSFSDFRPSALVEHADRASSHVQKKWLQIRNAESRFVSELWRLKEDLYGRLDYHLMNLLLKRYQESTAQPAKQEEKKK